MYFKWRKGCGGSEKFHRAVVDHDGFEKTRVLQGSGRTRCTAQEANAYRRYHSEVGGRSDFRLGGTMGARGIMRARHYKALWGRGFSVDVIKSS